MIARLLLYPPPMIVPRPSGFIKPCLPSKVSRPPTGSLCVHEIKHDGYRLMHVAVTIGRIASRQSLTLPPHQGSVIPDRRRGVFNWGTL